MEQADADAVLGPDPGHARLRRPRRLRPRDRGDHRGPRPEARDVAGGRRDRQGRGAVRDQHLVAFGGRPGRRDVAAGALPRPSLLQPRPGDAAARGGAVPRRPATTRSSSGSSSARSSARRRSPRGDNRGLHRQPPAGPLHARRDSRPRAGRRVDRGHRRRDEGRRQPPDGPADARRLRRPRHARLGRRRHARGYGEERFAPPPTPRRSSSRRATTAASRAAASTTTRASARRRSTLEHERATRRRRGRPPRLRRDERGRAGRVRGGARRPRSPAGPSATARRPPSRARCRSASGSRGWSTPSRSPRRRCSPTGTRRGSGADGVVTGLALGSAAARSR